MMEHVGIGHFDEYFLKIRELLTPDGYAFIHCIGRMSQPGTTGPFIRIYIFPGAYVPALSETFAATERCNRRRAHQRRRNHPRALAQRGLL